MNQNLKKCIAIINENHINSFKEFVDVLAKSEDSSLIGWFCDEGGHTIICEYFESTDVKDIHMVLINIWERMQYLRR